MHLFMSSFDVHEMADWNRVIDTLLPRLQSGAILTLSGPLGAGKTTFTQMLVKTLGSKQIPKSPTFALLNLYTISGRGAAIKRVLHVDAYRLEQEEDMRVLNLDEELQEPGTIVVMEWPERVENWLKRRTSAVLPMFIDMKDDVRRVRIG